MASTFPLKLNKISLQITWKQRTINRFYEWTCPYPFFFIYILSKTKNSLEKWIWKILKSSAISELSTIWQSKTFPSSMLLKFQLTPDTLQNMHAFTHSQFDCSCVLCDAMRMCRWRGKKMRKRFIFQMHCISIWIVFHPWFDTLSLYSPHNSYRCW